MDRNRQNENLGVNKVGKNIRKSPIHQPNFGNNAAARPQPQPQIYNISKNDFRNIVQQLTGSPSQDPPQPPRPPHNPPKPQSLRLQRIRPPPLTPLNRPNMPAPIPGPLPVPPPQGIVNSNVPRPAQFAQQPPPRQLAPPPRGDSQWSNPVAESPISAYMRYLQNSMMNPSPVANQPQFIPQPQFVGQMHPPQASTAGLLPNPNPNPPIPVLPSPRFNGPPSPMPNLPSPNWNSFAPLPSPTSQFLLPSPTGYYNLLSPKSPYPLLSPGIQFSPPLTPNFAFPAMPQSGILGPGPHPPPSPGIIFPWSPSGFFPQSSPRWRDQ